MVVDKWFFDEQYHTPQYGVNFSLKFSVAFDIIKHAALVSAKQDGEDTSGRQKLMLLTAEDVANRALDIADYLVNGALSRGWIKDVEISAKQRAELAGKYRRQGYSAGLEGNE